MRQHLQTTFTFSRDVAAAAKRRAQASFDAGDDALHLPPLAVLAAVESSFHLPAVTLAWPLAGATAVDRDHRRADAQGLAGQEVVGLGVVAAVGQQPVDVEVPT